MGGGRGGGKMYLFKSIHRLPSSLQSLVFSSPLFIFLQRPYSIDTQLFLLVLFVFVRALFFLVQFFFVMRCDWGSMTLDRWMDELMNSMAVYPPFGFASSRRSLGGARGF